jgi:hypothetical protein
VRNDPKKPPLFEEHKQWGEIEMNLFMPNKVGEKAGPVFVSTPYSGNERNRLFLGRGNNFDDASLISGVDFKEDGRGFGIFDFDRDGWLDLAIISPNQPRFRIAKNQMKEMSGSNNSFVEIRLVGGNHSAKSSTEWSSRDAVGARVVVTTGDTKRAFQISCGEGLSSQNTKSIHVGLGKSKQIDSLVVDWPSGKQTTRKNVAAGTKLLIQEKE